MALLIDLGEYKRLQFRSSRSRKQFSKAVSKTGQVSEPVWNSATLSKAILSSVGS